MRKIVILALLIVNTSSFCMHKEVNTDMIACLQTSIVPVPKELQKAKKQVRFDQNQVKKNSNNSTSRVLQRSQSCSDFNTFIGDNSGKIKRSASCNDISALVKRFQLQQPDDTTVVSISWNDATNVTKTVNQCCNAMQASTLFYNPFADLINNMRYRFRYSTFFIMRHGKDTAIDKVHEATERNKVQISDRTKELFNSLRDYAVYCPNCNRNKETGELLFEHEVQICNNFHEVKVDLQKITKSKASKNIAFLQMIRDPTYKSEISDESVNEACFRFFSSLLDICNYTQNGVIISNSMMMNCLFRYLYPKMKDVILFNYLTGFVVKVFPEIKQIAIYSKNNSPVIIDEHMLDTVQRLFEENILTQRERSVSALNLIPYAEDLVSVPVCYG